MAFKVFWDNHLLFSMLPGNIQAKDKEDDAKMLNPVLGTLAENINSTTQTIKITPTIVLESEGVLYIGSNNVGQEKILYHYDPTDPFYLTDCTRDYDGNGASSFNSGDVLYALPKEEGQLSRFLRLVEDQFDNIYNHTIELPYLKDPKKCPTDLLLYLSTERGWNDLDLTKDENYQRKFISFLPDIYKNKGTKTGLVDLIYLIGNIKGQIFNYWDFSFFIEEIYGHPSYISIAAITGEPDNPRIYRVHVPTLNTDYDEVRKVIRYSRPASQTCEVAWTYFYDDFSINLSYWSLGSVSKKTITSSNTLILERG